MVMDVHPYVSTRVLEPLGQPVEMVENQIIQILLVVKIVMTATRLVVTDVQVIV
jgi:hypothetical protein